jgi:signal transduction histidine kinase
MTPRPPAATTPVLAVELSGEHDVVLARQRARQIAALVGFDSQDQTRITTAVSEIVRNAFRYAGGGRVEFLLDGDPQEALRIRVTDRGPGIANLAVILRGQYESKTGMGLGLLGARRLMDRFDIDSTPGRGTCVTLVKFLPRRGGSPLLIDLARIGAELARASPHGAFEEVQQQNQELLHALAALESRQAELDQLNRELFDTNRGVMALYAELDEKAVQLQRASELKTSFLSHVSHEFRTPLNSILGLARLLQDRADGDLTAEQEKQVSFILRSAALLSDLVNDLLDTARIESGKVVVYPQEFTADDLISSLRGMFRPLLGPDATTSLQFGDVSNMPPLNTDEGKVAQILRNLVSNALKFTESGRVRVVASLRDDDIVFDVIDDGIGIAPEDHEHIFEEFGQVPGAVQRRVKGTGLGLPLSRKLAELLGGTLTVTSAVGVGSTFTVALPRRYEGPQEAATSDDQPTPTACVYSVVPIALAADGAFHA